MDDNKNILSLMNGKVNIHPRLLQSVHLCRYSSGGQYFMSWKAGVAAEIIGTPDGSIGKQLYYAKIWVDTDDLLCWTVIIVICSVTFEKLFMALLKGMEFMVSLLCSMARAG